MGKKITNCAKPIAYIGLIMILISGSINTHAQAPCTGLVLYSETFGTGTTATSNPDVTATYQETGPLSEGSYRIINNTQQAPGWHISVDLTVNDINGNMLVCNGTAGSFYTHRVDRPTGFLPGDYFATVFVMNVDIPGNCAPNPLLPSIILRVEYLSQANTWEPLTGSPYSAPAVTESAAPAWIETGSTFTLSPTGTFLVKSLRVVLEDATASGCGNDFAIDDISFVSCPDNGALPVEFLDIHARQKGGGVSIEWSTAQEINSESFIVERSAGGTSNWIPVISINAAGNSSVMKNYTAYDPQPFNGINFYRIKQVDRNGDIKYSRTVSVKPDFNNNGITVLNNPFHQSLTIVFSSAANQLVSVKLIDISGRQVAFEKLSINTGSSRKEFFNGNGLPQGVYILNISNDKGEILYNKKVIKQ